MAGNIPFGCGQCLPCRVNLRRLWTWRMYLESLMHKGSCFVTLTYSPEKLPESGSLVPAHARNFLKRVRNHFPPSTVRFFLCGEYGDQNERPHYHAILFGVDVVAGTQIVPKCWKDGFVYVGECNWKTTQYVAGYVLKKMSGPSDPRLRGRYPEFSRKSNRPGIGAAAMDVIVDAMFSPEGVKEFHRVGDVPHRLRIGGRFVPLGRYLRSKLRDLIGMPDSWKENLKDEFALERSLEMQALLSAAIDDPSFFGGVKEAFVAENQGAIWSIESKSRITQRGL